MASTCPHCGARVDGEECRDRFDRCLAKEFENPDTYGAVHHLTVISYMLQHNEYSRPAWLEAREMLSQFVNHGLTPAEARRKHSQTLDRAQRPWRVTEGEKITEVADIRWQRTIADVRLDNADLYRADVRRWAASVVADTEQLAR
ncbi:MAG TPA: DUF5946 family protein [Candidatus Sulfomarinibacteraceae bacterium]|nr:DUF5946 family protein [Candidatus Sulfomarinibacteraceae bacterium]